MVKALQGVIMSLPALGFCLLVSGRFLDAIAFKDEKADAD